MRFRYILFLLAILLFANASPAYPDTWQSIDRFALLHKMKIEKDPFLGTAKLTGEEGSILVAAGSRIAYVNERAVYLSEAPRYRKSRLCMKEGDFSEVYRALQKTEGVWPERRRQRPVRIIPEGAGKGGSIRRIVLDPGHGGPFTGAVGPGGTMEKDITLAIAKKCAAILKGTGFEVLLTRTGDYALDRDLSADLDARCIFANRNNADVFVSIHINASKHETAQGYETFVVDNRIPVGSRVEFVTRDADLPDFDVGAAADTSRQWKNVNFHLLLEEYWYESFELARLVQQELSGVLYTPNRGVKHNQGLRVLRFTGCPAVLVEVGFLSNPQTEKELGTSSQQQKIAAALASAIVKFKRLYGK